MRKILHKFGRPGAFAILALCTCTAVPRLAPAEETRTVRIHRGDCDRLVRHVPAPDVAFQPGVDSHGRPVAPADLPSPTLDLPETIGISIRVDLLERFGIPATPQLFEAEADIGILELEGDRMLFNGRLISGEDAAELAAACREAKTSR